MQLALTFDKQAWQMTLAEYHQTLMVDMPVAWYGPCESQELCELRDMQQMAYVRRGYKWAVIRARQAGEDVPVWVYGEHPVLAKMYLEQL